MNSDSFKNLINIQFVHNLHISKVCINWISYKITPKIRDAIKSNRPSINHIRRNRR